MENYSSLSDERLVVLCRADDGDAWDELSKRYLKVSGVLSAKMKNCPVENDDLIQEGMLGFFSAVYGFCEDRNAGFRTFAVICMKNRMMNAVKACAAKKQIPSQLCVSLESELNDSVGFASAAANLSPEEILVSKNEAQRISALIDSSLSENERRVFILCLSGNSYADISNKTGLSTKAVDGTLQRARKKLREKISQ